ncbi:hypothetical protein G9A89_008753 [Geosiphon pyriformis]|nr:hypothetical protein G9A89_008753 [Geosiphon pyriformis]
MSQQNTFLEIPNYSKTYLYPKPTNLYHYYANAFAYAEMVNAKTWRPAKQKVLDDANRAWILVRNQEKEKIYEEINTLLNIQVNSSQVTNLIDIIKSDNQPLTAAGSFNIPIDHVVSITPSATNQITQSSHSPSTPTSKNAAAQKQALQDIEDAKRRVEEYKQLVSLTTDEDLVKDLYLKLQQAEASIIENQKKLKRLRSGAQAQERFRQKRRKRMDETSNVSAMLEPFEVPNQQNFLIETVNVSVPLQPAEPIISSSPTSQTPIMASMPTSKNAVAQKQALEDIEHAKNKVEEYKQLVQLTIDEEVAKDLYFKIQQAETSIIENQKKLKKLKSGAEAQERFRQKRKKRLEKVSDASTNIELNKSPNA